MKGRVNTGGGGGLNASVILVIAPTGSTVTCVKGDKTKAAVEKNGLWTFRGIENGEWTVKATKDGQSTGQVVDVNQLDVYRVTLAYFNATIETTFPTDCTSVTCTKDSVVFSVPSGSLSSGSYTFNIPETGEWVLYCTNGTKEKSVTVSVIEEKAYSTKLSFELVLFERGVSSILAFRNEPGYNGKWFIDAQAHTVYAKMTGDDTHFNPGTLYATPSVDVTDFSTLYVTGGWATEDVVPIRFAVGTGDGSGVVGYVNISEKAPTTKTIDISQLSGNHYVFSPDIGDIVNRYKGGQWDLYKIWLE